MVKNEYLTNIRYWDNIRLWEDYSYDVVDKFVDESFDFVYMLVHTYDEVKNDLQLYLPKVKQGGFIGGRLHGLFRGL